MNDFIPKQEKTDIISLRIDIEKIQLIDKLAQKNGLSRNKFITQCIDFALQHLPEEYKEK